MIGLVKFIIYFLQICRSQKPIDLNFIQMFVDSYVQWEKAKLSPATRYYFKGHYQQLKEVIRHRFYCSDDGNGHGSSDFRRRSHEEKAC